MPRILTDAKSGRPARTAPFVLRERVPCQRNRLGEVSAVKREGAPAMTALKLRILFDGAMIGPGKAELLERLGERVTHHA